MISVRRSSPNFSRTAWSSSTTSCISSSSLDRIARSRSMVFISSSELVEDLLALEAGQPLQLHVEDRLRLELRQLELQLQALARFGGALRSANQLDHFVEVIERDLEAFEDMGPGLGLAQLELGPAPDDFAAELDEVLETSSRLSTFGRPPAIASMMMPNVVCSGVCL